MVAIGYGDFNDAMAAQPESNGESCNFVRFAQETNEVLIFLIFFLGFTNLCKLLLNFFFLRFA